MKKKLLILCLCIIVLTIGKNAVGRFLDKNFLSEYNVESLVGDTRFDTLVSINKLKWKESSEAILINTNNIDIGICTSPYAYQKNLPVFYTERDRMDKGVLEEILKLGVEKVYVVGGLANISDHTERTLNRYNIKTERIAEKRGIDLSIAIAEKMDKIKPITEIALISANEFNLPNGISFMPIASKNNIPILIMDYMDRDKAINYINSKNNIEKVYVIGNEGKITESVYGLFPNVEKVVGKDRFDVNKKIIEKFYAKKDVSSIVVSKGAGLRHKKHLTIGEQANALSSNSLSVDTNSPILFTKTDILLEDDLKLMEKYPIKDIYEIGFNIKRNPILNAERLRIITAVLMIIISLFMLKGVFTNKK